MQQVSLVQVLTGLRRYFRSIDVRTVIIFEESTLPLPLLTGIRISSKPVGTIKEHYAELVRRFGPRTTKRLKVRWTAAPYGRFQKIHRELLSGKIFIERKQIPLSNTIEFDKFSTSIVRRQQFEVESSSGGTWPSVLFSGGRSPACDKIVRVYNRADITTELIRETRCRSVEEFVGTFLEVVRPNTYDRDFFVQIEMPARIRRAEIQEGRARIEVEGERTIRDLKLSIQVRTSSDRPPIESKELIPEKVAENGGLAVLEAKGQLAVGKGERFISIVLSHRSGLEIDEEHINLSRMAGAEEQKEPSVLTDVFQELKERALEIETREAERLRGRETGISTSSERIRKAFEELDLHARIAKACGELYRDGHYRNAVLDACLSLVALVKERSGCDLDGAKLMRTVFSRQNPILAFNDLKDQSEQDEQEGMMHLYEGAVLALRNPRAHALFDDSPERALEYIAMLSTLAKRVEETIPRKKT